MRVCGDTPHGLRARGLIVVLGRAGLRSQEALDLTKPDLDSRRGSVPVRRGKGGHRRKVGMDDWGFEQLESWLKVRQAMPVGPPFCVISGPACGRAWSSSAARADLKRRVGARASASAFVPDQLGTPTPSSSRTRACPSTSSSANSDTAISAIVDLSCRAST